MRLETVREQDAYDEGFANGKDYWGPLEQERILNLLEENFKRFDVSNNMVDFMTFEEFKTLVEETN
jgi:hypothetical protein